MLIIAKKAVDASDWIVFRRAGKRLSGAYIRAHAKGEQDLGRPYTIYGVVITGRVGHDNQLPDFLAYQVGAGQTADIVRLGVQQI